MGFLKLLLGFLLAIAILAGGGAAAALYFMNKMAVLPPRPVFANDKSVLKAQHLGSAKVKAKQASASKPHPKPTPQDNSSPKPLAPGTYRAKVTWPEGLSLRSQPSLEAERVGGVAYNQPVVVLEENADKSWQRIQIEHSNQQGWVRTGNTERVEEQPQRTNAQ